MAVTARSSLALGIALLLAWSAERRRGRHRARATKRGLAPGRATIRVGRRRR